MADAGISVIMPVYNSEKTLGVALQSLLKQNVKKMQIIVIDDCSTDKSLAIARSILRNKKNITIRKMTENKGAPHCMNVGILVAKFDRVSIFDSDAEAPPGWLKLMMREMDDGFDIVGGKYKHPEKEYKKNYFANVFNIIETNFLPKKDIIYDITNNENEPAIIGGNFIFKKKVHAAIGEFNTKIRAGYDRLFLCKAVENGYKVKYVEKSYIIHPLYNYKSMIDPFKRASFFHRCRIAALNESELLGKPYRKAIAFLALGMVAFFCLLALTATKIFLSIVILTLLIGAVATAYTYHKKQIKPKYWSGVFIVKTVNKIIALTIYILKIKPKQRDWKER